MGEVEQLDTLSECVGKTVGEVYTNVIGLFIHFTDESFICIDGENGLPHVISKKRKGLNPKMYWTTEEE